MKESLASVEIVDVYEPPLLVEAGDYAEATQGPGHYYAEGPMDHYAM
ncbi:lasso RiPP family leader peptide-containing protein [Streptomyces sp. NPDC050617]